jgi:hypothetical protein
MLEDVGNVGRRGFPWFSHVFPVGFVQLGSKRSKQVPAHLEARHADLVPDMGTRGGSQDTDQYSYVQLINSLNPP